MKYKVSYVLAFVMLIFHAGWMLFTFGVLHVNGGEVLIHEYSAVIRFIEMGFSTSVMILGIYCLVHYVKYCRRKQNVSH